MRRVIVGNVFNQLMIERYTIDHSEPLKNASSRKIWLAQAGDIVVTQRPVSDELKAHVQRITGTPKDLVTCLTINEDQRILSNELCIEAKGDPVEILPYALEHPISLLSSHLNCPIALYDDPPQPELIDLICDLNTKSGFRRLAADLGLTIPGGQTAQGRQQLIKVCTAMLRQSEKVIVKLDRSSNGYGSLIMSQDDSTELSDRLAHHFAEYDTQPDQYVVEECIDFVALPSIEMTVHSDGVRFDYICDQRMMPKAGMEAPASRLSERTIHALIEAGSRLGNWLHKQGYRGVFDLDGCCLDNGKMVYTEANIRRTAGSHLHEIANRLLGDSYTDDSVWLSGSFDLSGPRSLARLEKLVALDGLLFDRASRRGIIFPNDHPTGEKCFYQIFARSHEEASHMENQLWDILRRG